MKCLTIMQPWAWAIVGPCGSLGGGPKRVENRTWACDFRGPLLIHAGRSRRWLQPTLPNGLPVNPRELEFGAIVGVAMMTGCMRGDYCATGDPFVEGPWCWVLPHRQAFRRPIPYSGQQGLFNVPDAVVAWALAEIGWTAKGMAA